jgi:ribosomal protein L29
MAATPAPPLVQPPSDSEVNERDLYIEHLVKRIHEWEQRYFEMAQSVDAIVAPGHERVDALEAELHNLRAQQAALFEAVHRQDDLDTGEHARLQKAAPVESPEAEKLGESSEEE